MRHVCRRDGIHRWLGLYAQTAARPIVPLIAKAAVRLELCFGLTESPFCACDQVVETRLGILATQLIVLQMCQRLFTIP